MLRLLLLSAVLFLLGESVFAQSDKQPFTVLAPKGWGKESIPLPPGFAKDMKWEGLEEIRFAPDWRKAEAGTFFSYAMLFWLPADAKTDTKTMEREILTYYRGLAKAVMEGRKQKVDADAFTFTIKEADPKTGKRPGGEPFTAYVGELKWTEPFTTGKPQTLRLEIQSWTNEKPKRQCLFLCVSPQPVAAEIWKSLREIRDGVAVP